VDTLANEKGLSLLEVLAAVTILTMVILSVSYLFTTNYKFSSQEATRDLSVNIARSVIEDLKPAIQAGVAATLFSNNPDIATPITITANDINLLRDNLPNTLTYDYIIEPNINLDITIRDIEIPNLNAVSITDALDASHTYQFVMNQFFSHIEVQVTDNLLNTTFTLQSYLEKVVPN
jgi:type II secretory pathway pseudopilin PulG